MTALSRKSVSRALVALAFLPLLSWQHAQASNVRIGNLHWGSSAELSLDLSWDHSWNLLTEPSNHDAVWLFAKIRISGTSEWQHLDLYSASTESNFDAIVSQDSKGCMVSRAIPGSGPVENLEITLTLPVAMNETVDVKLFAVEMVYVSPGSFELGDGISTNSFTGTDGGPFEVTSEAAIAAGELLTLGGIYTPDAEVPVAYPKGFAGFYVMKYELSQEGYIGMLNTLDWSSQQSRTAVSGSWAFDPDNLHRNGIAVASHATADQPAVFAMDGDRNGVFNEDEDGGTRAANGLDWEDMIAWLDWAALRPLTELEYEKACRGSQSAVPGEFAWGTDAVLDANTIELDGSPEEHCLEVPAVQQGIASHGYAGPQGPLRNGFSASAGSDRLRSGASYYGAMELSGNLWELCVSVIGGLSYTGEHGDGQLSDGSSDQADWPDASGAGFRGGAWNSGIGPVGTFRDLAVSDRWYAGLSPDSRRFTTGIRGARTMN